MWLLWYITLYCYLRCSSSNLALFITLWWALAASAQAFRFDEGASGGMGGGGLFGDVGLMNAVPRIGRKRALNTNPFDSRFRFRFNNWIPSQRVGSGAGFRFQGGDGTPSLLMRKRMAESLQTDLEKLRGAPAESSVESKMGEIRDDLKWYKVKWSSFMYNNVSEFNVKVADQYWREYLEDLARREALAKMVRKKYSLNISNKHFQAINFGNFFYLRWKAFFRSN